MSTFWRSKCCGPEPEQDFYTDVVDYIAESDRLNGTAFSNASLDPGGASSALAGGDDAQLEGLPKLVMQVDRLALAV